jgi:archaetidylinositol phosphate synthase
VSENSVLSLPNSLPVTAGKPDGTSFKKAVRIQESFTARIEKKALIWMAERMPAWVNSDHLTLLGTLGMVLAGASYFYARWNRIALLLAILFLALNWFGDSLDGTLARVRNRQRPRYGFYVDHIVDAFGALALMLGLAFSGYVHPSIAIGMLISFLLLSIEVHLATYTLGKFQMSYWKFGPTEIRILLAIGNLKLFIDPFAHIAGQRYLLFDVGGLVAIAGMSLMLTVSTIRHTHRLYAEEKLS